MAMTTTPLPGIAAVVGEARPPGAPRPPLHLQHYQGEQQCCRRHLVVMVVVVVVGVVVVVVGGGVVVVMVVVVGVVVVVMWRILVVVATLEPGTATSEYSSNAASAAILARPCCKCKS